MSEEKKRKFEVDFYWQKWISDEEIETLNCRTEFECDVPSEITFNGKGIFGIVRDAFIVAEREKYHRSVTVKYVMELPTKESGNKRS